MAARGRTKEREIVSAYELQLADCVYFCLHHAYPLHHLAAFAVEFTRDWNMNAFAVWADELDARFAIFGKSTEPSMRRRAAHGRAAPGWRRRRELADHTPPATFDTCAALIEMMLQAWSFSTPGSSKALRSTMTVYQQVGFGTCWLAAVLNLLLHIPDTRIALWNALHKKIPKMDDTTLEFFVRTPIGRRIYERYSEKVERKTGNFHDVLGSTPSKRGGFPKYLVEAMQSVIPDLREMVPFNHGSDVRQALRRAVRDGDDASALQLVQTLEALISQHGVVGGILSGLRSATAPIGHAVAICMDPDAHHKMRIHNHGISGREHTLAHFLKLYAHDTEILLYRIAPLRRCNISPTASAFC